MHGSSRLIIVTAKRYFQRVDLSRTPQKSLSRLLFHCTCHSLGAALALLSQIDLIKAEYGATKINFAQPRFSKKYFARFLPSKLSTLID
jgi:hypothetical protein